MRLLLFSFLLAALWSNSEAATITAANCSVAAVQTAVNTSTTGDTVRVPAGSCTWSTQLNGYEKAISLIGAGIGQTIITDGTPKGDSNCGNIQALMVLGFSTPFPAPVRVSGFTIIGQPSPYNCGESAKHIFIGGWTTQFRIDHNEITLGVTGINVNDAQGVIDHNTFHDPLDKFTVLVQARTWKGVGDYGDNSWAQADTLGQAEAVYIEANVFDFPSFVGAPFPVGCFDTEGGGRLVFRFNAGCPWVGMHGLDSSGRLRSGRHYEIYNNDFVAQVNQNGNMFTGVFLRGGTGMIFNNTFTDVSGSPYLGLVRVNSYRSTAAYSPWGPSYAAGACDGRGPFDANTGLTYASGTHTGSTSTDVLTDASKTWTTDVWYTYSLINMTRGWGSGIDSNTAHTISTEGAAQGAAHTWSNGDTYEIRKAYPCTDQIGRGAGTYISGTNPTPIGPVNQASDPMYAWLNTHNGTPTYAAISSAHSVHVQENRDFYNWNASFNGTVGVGSGLLSARPATCTAGVAYWATDTTTLYKCTATNTWSVHYRPYPYPHPLTAGGIVPLPVPTNIRIEADVIKADVVPAASTCDIYLDSSPKINVAAAENVCAFDARGIATGAHSVAVKAKSDGDPTYGTQDSAATSPVAFTQPQVAC